MALVLATVATMLGKDVSLVLQVEQRPVVMVAAQDDAATLAAVAAVRPAIRIVLHVAQVHGASAALARAAQNLHIVNEITLRHVSLFFAL